ncbi:MAG: 5'-methylthioadenosine/S-adenosylhomocysteine nucleosidase, partial [Chloroflexi bacterium]|nr:5'-methylthioadenosine/S-adenosylhomocysteine nucleosidase [Chloroflexota bacterium]
MARRIARPIAVLGATAAEVEPLRLALGDPAPEQRAGFDIWPGRLGDADVVLVRSGPGKVWAAAAAQLALERFRPRCLLMTGACGSLDPAVGVGDVLLAERLVPHDLAWVTGAGDVRDGVPYTDAEGHTFRLASLVADPALLAEAARAASGLHLPAPEAGGPARRALPATVASGDQFIASTTKRRWLREAFGALGCEREGLAAAQVALAHGLPFLLIKGASDAADETIDGDPARLLLWEDQHALDQAYRRLAAGETLPTPIGDGLRASFRYAAANAARVVEALIAGRP